MENASKALLIAASVLVAILLIALGIRIFGSTRGATDEVDAMATELEIQMFNSQFEKYEGKQSASQVQALLRYAKRVNAKGEHTVSFQVKHGSGVNSGLTPDYVLSTYAFKNIGLIDVSVLEYDDNGFITSIELYNEDFDYYHANH